MMWIYQKHYKWDNTDIMFILTGIARLVSESRSDVSRVPWVLPPSISASQLGGVFKLDWIHRLHVK